MKIGLAILFFLLLNLSCKNDYEVKPTEIFYGQEICERCKMIISEEVFSAQYILQGEKVKKFDDIGCMIHYLFKEETHRDKVLALFVKDGNSKEWIDGEKAYYVRSKNIKTPMGYGLVAFRDKESAEKLVKTKEGAVFEGFDETVNWVLNQGQK